MKKSARLVTLSAVFLALTLVFMYMGNLLPSARVAAVAIASLLTVAAVIETGISSAILVYFGSLLLGFLILPDKTTVTLYALFFGFYPIIKSLSERIKPKVLQWATKIVVFNAAFSVVWFLFRELIFSAEAIAFGTILIYLAANAAFILYDIGLTRLIGFYIVRISKNLKNNR